MTRGPSRAPSEGRAAIATRGLGKTYGGVVALAGVDLHVPQGAVYVLAGANGAGKTTLMEILLGLVRPDAGTAEVLGLDARTQGAEVRAQIGYVSASHSWEYGWMPVGHLMRHHAAFYPTWDADYAARLARLFELPLGRRFGVLSRGFARRVGSAWAGFSGQGCLG